MQRLPNGAVWDERAVLEDLRGYVVEHLGQLVEMSGITTWSTISMASRLVTGWLFSTIW
jgi:hypothetical protein